MPAPTSLVERSGELELLAGRIRALRVDGGGCVLVSGEAGVGKTSLLKEARRQAGSGVDWWWGSCEPLLSPPALAPLLDLLDRLPPALSAAVRAGRATPDVLEGMLGLLRDRASPTVLVIDDAQWADEATLDLLRWIGRRIEQTRALLVVSHRDEALTPGHALRGLLGALPSPCTSRIALAPLSLAAVAELAGRGLRDAGELHRVSQGNPFFVTEVLATSGDALPTAVHDAVLARARPLSMAGRELLDLVSVAPAELEVGIVDAVLDDASTAIDECTGAGLLQRESGALRFRHELARLSIESACAPLRLQALHHAVFDALELRGASAARLVHHARHAGLDAAVSRLAPLAAAEAAQAGAHREAAALYELALEHGPAVRTGERARLWVACADAHAATQRLDAALRARRQALLLHREAGDLRAQGCDLREMARLEWFGGDIRTGIGHATEAMLLLARAGATRELAMARATMAQLHMLDEDMALPLGWGLQALASFEALGDAEGTAYALNSVGFARLIRDDLPQAWQQIERSLSIARAHELDDHVSRAYVNLASLALVHRRLDALQAWCEEGIAWADARDQDMYGACLRLRSAYGCIERGDWMAARDSLQRLQAQLLLTPIEREQTGHLLALLDARQGRDSSTQDVGATPAGPGIDPWYAPRAVAQAEAAWLRGENATAASVARAALPGALRSGERWRIGQLACWLHRAGAETVAPPITPPGPCALELAGDLAGAAAAWAALGCRYEQALLLLGGTATQLQQALAILETLGAAPAAAIARRRLRAAGIRTGTRGPYGRTRADPLGLTPRERQVLALLGEGLSNRAIAQRLHRSERTVEHHVAALLVKLDVGHRDAAVEAARRGASAQG